MFKKTNEDTLESFLKFEPEFTGEFSIIDYKTFQYLSRVLEQDSGKIISDEALKSILGKFLEHETRLQALNLLLQSVLGEDLIFLGQR